MTKTSHPGCALMRLGGPHELTAMPAAASQEGRRDHGRAEGG